MAARSTRTFRASSRGRTRKGIATGQAPTAYLVLGVNKSRRYAANRWAAQDRTDRNTADVSEKDGGIQTEYEDEDPEVHKIFEAELAKRGVQCRMKNLVAGWTGVPG